MIQNLSIMGLSEFWSWIVQFFSNFFEGSRYQEEKVEQADRMKAAKITENEEKLEKKENEQLDIIYLELGKIQKKLSGTKKPIMIPIGNTELDVAQAVGALKRAIYKLISTKISIKREEATLASIKMYWQATQQGLSTEMIDEVNEISKAFKKLKVELKKEDEMTETKLELIKEAYNLAMKEEGTATQTGEAKGGATAPTGGKGTGTRPRRRSRRTKPLGGSGSGKPKKMSKEMEELTKPAKWENRF